MSQHIDRVADLETNLRETESQLSQCAEFGQQLVASLNEAKANLDEAHHESEMLREENAELKASIVDAKSEIRNGAVRQEMFECEKQDILRDNKQLKHKLNAANALANSKTEELDRVVSMKAVAPGINLIGALPKPSSPSSEPLRQNSPRHNVSPDATTQTLNSGVTVVSLETEVGRLQGLLKGVQDDLDHERRMRNEKAAGNALTTIPSETNLMSSESYNFLEPVGPTTVNVTEPVFVAQKKNQKKEEIVSVASVSSVAVVGTGDKGGGCCIVM